MRLSRATGLLVLLVLWPAMTVRAVGDDESVTCAVVPAGGSGADAIPALPFVEVALAREPGLRLVERARIEGVLGEQLLQRSFGAGELRARQELGHLLRADLLVVLGQSGSKETSCLSLTIAETRGGLRLARADFPWSAKQPEDAVASVVEAVQAARRQLGERIRVVLAVPPFENEDLSYKYDRLMTAYALLLERALAHGPGALVVELDEARALARELAISEGRAAPGRITPHFVLGRFRNTGYAESRTVTLWIELRRGEDSVQTWERAELNPDDVAAFLQSVATDIRARALGTENATTSLTAAQEAGSLRARAGALANMQHAEEALPLYEASLLLEPNDVGARVRAVILYAAVLRRFHCGKNNERLELEAARQGLPYYRAGVAHLEYTLRLWAHSSYREFYHLPNRGELDSAVGELREFTEYAQRKGAAEPGVNLVADWRNMIFAIVDAFAQKPTSNLETGDLASLILSGRVLWGWRKLGQPESLEAEYAERLHVARALRFLDRGWLKQIATNPFPKDAERLSPAYERFLTDLEEIDPRRAGPVVRELREENERIRAGTFSPEKERAARDQGPRRPKPMADPDVEFVKVDLPIGINPTDWFPCGPTTDFITCDSELYLMKEKGRPQLVARSQSRRGIQGACYDGRLVWAAVAGAESRILAIRPETGEVVEFTEADGLQPMNGVARVGPATPGRICLSATFRGPTFSSRGWMALLELDEQGHKRVTVVQEMRSAGQSANFIATLADPDNPTDRRVLVGHAFSMLLINPDDNSVSTRNARIDCPVPYEGALYYVKGPQFEGTGGMEVQRATWPGLKPEVLASLPVGEQSTRLLFDGDTLHIAAKSWWIAEKPFHEFRQLRGNFPGQIGFRHPCLSRHYGILLVTVGSAFQVHFRAQRVTTQNAEEVPAHAP